MNNKKTKKHTVINENTEEPGIPISFVVVKYSSNYQHDFLHASCIKNTLNQVIRVNNEAGLFFDNLSEAIIYGIRQANHDIIAVAQEDVILSNDWQRKFVRSLRQLELYDPDWGMLGPVGWDTSQIVHGHWSGPHQHKNTFKDSPVHFHEAVRLDEQLLIFHRKRLPQFDPDLPSIHHISLDLNLTSKILKAYAIDAPITYNHVDEDGTPIQNRDKSRNMLIRTSPGYLADRMCCDEYMMKKWPHLDVKHSFEKYFSLPSGFNNKEKHRQLLSPVILISRGGSGSRLLSIISSDLGVFIGNNLNKSGDAIEMVIPIYQSIIEKYQCHAQWQKRLIRQRLLAHAARMIKDIDVKQTWGFKLPESIFLLPELLEIFQHARFIHFIRDPLTACLRRTHMTARIDNHIGRLSLSQAYDFHHIERKEILNHSPAEHMAYTTIHQLSLVNEFKKHVDTRRFLEIKFEDTLSDPDSALESVSSFLNLPPKSETIINTVDKSRAANPATTYSKNTVNNVKILLKDIRRQFEYL